MYTMRMLDQNGGNASNPAAAAAASNLHLNNSTLGNSLHASLSSSLGTMSAGASGNDRLDASSDSAVSSMGSERVASLSDGEWNEAGSDSAQEYNM
jgi:nuclear factor erythroid 2, invertebrate